MIVRHLFWCVGPEHEGQHPWRGHVVALELEHEPGFEGDTPDAAWLVAGNLHQPIDGVMRGVALAAGRTTAHWRCPLHDMLNFERNRLTDVQVAAYLLGGNKAVAALLEEDGVLRTHMDW